MFCSLEKTTIGTDMEINDESEIEKFMENLRPLKPKKKKLILSAFTLCMDTFIHVYTWLLD